MTPANSPKTGAKPKRKPPQGKPFVKDDPRINRKGRPKLASEIREMLRDPALAEKWADKIRRGVEAGDVELLKLYGKHAVGTEDKLELDGKVKLPLEVPALKELSVVELRKLMGATKK